MSSFAVPPAAVLAEIPHPLPLQIVTSCAPPPEGDAWLHEIKDDGHRLLAIISAGDELQLISRNGHDRTAMFRAPFQGLACHPWCSMARSPCPMSAALPISMR